MEKRLHIEGAWPKRIVIQRGWARATARPWNNDTADVALHLHRGGHDFLARATQTIREIHLAPVYSPALYRTGARIWKRVGYEVFADLQVMERSLAPEIGAVSSTVTEMPPDQIERLLDVDHDSFERFWRMSVAGIEEALLATPRAAILISTNAEKVTGYAIVGTQLNVSFLQRVAVPPEHSGRGLGTALILSSLKWARRKGASSMLLNVRSTNRRAAEIYTRLGFEITGTTLELLEYRG